ncbi:hypothetical protein Y032_0651g1138, partial [Ancylostoma ceylanicum]
NKKLSPMTRLLVLGFLLFLSSLTVEEADLNGAPEEVGVNSEEPIIEHPRQIVKHIIILYKICIYFFAQTWTFSNLSRFQVKVHVELMRTVLIGSIMASATALSTALNRSMNIVEGHVVFVEELDQK